MLKENKGKLILTSIIILLPIIAGLFLWKTLPEQVPTHWNAEGVVDGWSSKEFAVLGMPVFLLFIHWICIAGSSADPKRRDYSPKMWNIVLWICPAVSVFVAVMTYGTALGMEFKMDKVMPVLMGLVFVIIGNYMPKCKQNYTLGIKLPWTLNDEDNWNYTHRLAGKLWVIGGLLFMFFAFLPAKLMVPVLFIFIFVMVGIPMVCSYLFYKKKASNKN